MDDIVDLFSSIFLSCDQRMIAAAIPSKQSSGESLWLICVIVNEEFSGLELLEELQFELSQHNVTFVDVQGQRKMFVEILIVEMMFHSVRGPFIL